MQNSFKAHGFLSTMRLRLSSGSAREPVLFLFRNVCHEAIHSFQSHPAQRAQYFDAVQRTLGRELLKMPQSCDTRWYSKHKGVRYFRNRLKSTLLALQTLVDDGRADEIIL